MKKYLLAIGLFTGAAFASGCAKKTEYVCEAQEVREEMVVKTYYTFVINTSSIISGTKKVDGLNTDQIRDEELADFQESYQEVEGSNAKEKLANLLKEKLVTSSVTCSHA